MKNIDISQEHRELLFSIPLFRDLDKKIKEQLLDVLDYKIVEIEVNEIFANQGDLCKSLFVLLKGRLKVDIIDSNGSEVLIEHLIAPRAFATPHLFKQDSRLPATFTAIEETTILIATKESAFDLISKNPHILKSFLKVSGNCNACTTARLDILSKKTIRERLIVYFSKHNKIGETTFSIPHSLTQLAEYINVSRPALSTEFNKMEKEGLIKRIEKNVIELEKSFRIYI